MEKQKKKIYLLPKTRIGKISLVLGLLGLITIILLNVIEEADFCSICPGGYRLNGNICNPECYYSNPPCLSPSIEPSCNMNLVENNLWRTFKIIFGLLAMASILGSGIISLISIIKYYERSILIFIPLILGVLGLLFVFGEFLFPH